MDESTTREKVLKKIRNALISKTDNPYPSLDMDSSVYKDFTDLKDVTFAEEFTRAGGKFVYCENESDLRVKLQSIFSEKDMGTVLCFDPDLADLLDKCGIIAHKDEDKFLEVKTGVTGCEFLIARFGSILVSSKQLSGRRMNVFPETHIIIAKISQIVVELKDAIVGVKKKYAGGLPSMLTVITGPSRTADIEKTLVMGAHGPKELFVLLIDEV